MLQLLLRSFWTLSELNTAFGKHVFYLNQKDGVPNQKGPVDRNNVLLDNLDPSVKTPYM
jgi:hypothetical protein